MANVAIIGSGPTGIYTLAGLIKSTTPLSITVFEASADPGKGTPYHPRVNDKAMLANIASIEIPPICVTLTDWLRSLPLPALAALGVQPNTIRDREFFPRIVLGAYFQAQFNELIVALSGKGHAVEIKSAHRVTDVRLEREDITVVAQDADGNQTSLTFDHVVMATGHDWPEATETKPGYFISPWPAKNLDTIGEVSVGVLGTSLSGIDSVVSVATSKGSFLTDGSHTLQYFSDADPDFHVTMMSRKGLLPEADFYFPIPYEPLDIFTRSAVDHLVETSRHNLLDRLFDLFRNQLHACDPEYSERIGLGILTVETISDAYFAERNSYDPFTWAALNLGEAKANEATETTVPWRYAILRMHEEILRAVPFLSDIDLKRFHKHFKSLFVDDYATVPHQSIERLLALHRAGRLSVVKLGSEYRIDSETVDKGAVVVVNDRQYRFDALIDATGQSAVSAWDVPFPSLIEQGVVREARTEEATSALAAREDTALVATGGIDLDEYFRPRFEKPLSNNLYCISIPFLLHKLPFIQGITSAFDLGNIVSEAILRATSPVAASSRA
jgi:uncharacterized NAD(P)/FAD-binding protein YdhS